MNKAMDTAYSVLIEYVKRNNLKSTFDGNTLRARLATVKGLRKHEIGGVVSKAIQYGIIDKIGDTVSNKANHKGARVGVYSRGVMSYVI